MSPFFSCSKTHICVFELLAMILCFLNSVRRDKLNIYVINFFKDHFLIWYNRFTRHEQLAQDMINCLYYEHWTDKRKYFYVPLLNFSKSPKLDHLQQRLSWNWERTKKEHFFSASTRMSVPLTNLNSWCAQFDSKMLTIGKKLTAW